MVPSRWTTARSSMTASSRRSPRTTLAIKGHAVRLTATGTDGSERGRRVCFDGDLLRYSAGWTGGFLALSGVAYDGKHGPPGPSSAGTQIFGTPTLPGWALGTEGAASPIRAANRFGPLPRSTGRFTAEYRSGNQVVLAYTVGGGSVLELPGSRPTARRSADDVGERLPRRDRAHRRAEGCPGHRRRRHRHPVRARRVRQRRPGRRPGRAQAGDRRPAHRATVPATAKALFKLVIAPGTATELCPVLAGATATTDPATLTKGGPGRFPAVVETVGQVGTTGGAYVVDTITLPEQNP